MCHDSVIILLVRDLQKLRRKFTTFYATYDLHEAFEFAVAMANAAIADGPRARISSLPNIGPLPASSYNLTQPQVADAQSGTAELTFRYNGAYTVSERSTYSG